MKTAAPDLLESQARRRRFWSDDEKQRFVSELEEPDASASIVAQRHGLNANLLFTWPSTAGEAVTISTAQLGYRLSGIDWRMPQKTWRPTASG